MITVHGRLQLKGKIRSYISSAYFLWISIFSVFLLLYVLTSQRGVSWQDSGNFQFRAINNILVDTSLVISHPLYIFLAHLFSLIPVGSPEGRVNAFSGLGMAFALANLGTLAFALTRKRHVSVLMVLTLGLAHSVWWLSTIAEVYTWSVAGLTAEILLLYIMLKKPQPAPLMGLALVNGLGFAIHNFALLPLPVYVGVVIWLWRQKVFSTTTLLIAGGIWILGAGMYLYEIIMRMYETASIFPVVADALWGKWDVYVFNLRQPPSLVNVVLAGLSFINLLLPLALFGLLRIRRYLPSPLAVSFVSITALEVLFVVRYPVKDQFTFILPTLIMITLLATIGVHAFEEEFPRWRFLLVWGTGISILVSMSIYLVGPTLIRSAGLEPHRARVLPFRDEIRYWLVPWKFNENSAELFAYAALEDALPNGIIIAHWTPRYPLKLVQRHQRRYAHIWIPTPFDPVKLPHYSEQPQLFCAMIGQRPLYVVSPIPGYADENLLRDSIQVRKGVLYRVLFKPGGCPHTP